LRYLEYRLFPIAADGWRFILPLLAGGIGLSLLPHWAGKTAGSAFLVLTAFCLFFFRDFDRPTTIDDNLIYSPADGKILEVSNRTSDSGEKEHVIRIFLSIFNVHVQRAPLVAQVQKVEYKKGSFLDARSPKAHLENEQNSLTLSSPYGKIKVTQIAGLIARRIVCWVKEGDSLKQGERFGLIRFGSQVDLIIPGSAQVLLQKGDSVRGGETVVAKWK